MHKKINSFELLDLVNNRNFDILIGDESNNVVHIIVLTVTLFVISNIHAMEASVYILTTIWS